MRMAKEIQHIFITGASSGIGRETARRLAASGKSLFLTGRASTKLEETSEACRAAGASAVKWEAGDLTQPGVACRLAEAATKEMGKLDATVHCAGVGLVKSSTDIDDAEFTRVTNINLRATFLVAKAACRIMADQGGGRFVTLPGILGKFPMKGMAAYCASKFGVTGMLKCMALELQRKGIQFTLLHLGGVDTPFYDGLAMNPQRDKMISAETAAQLVVGALEAPAHLVLNEIVMQPDVHQFL